MGSTRHQHENFIFAIVRGPKAFSCPVVFLFLLVSCDAFSFNVASSPFEALLVCLAKIGLSTKVTAGLSDTGAEAFSL